MGERILGIDVDDATDALRGRALAPPVAPTITGVPASELLRSPAASVVADAAAASGLFLFHYEHRAPQELPDAWILPGSEHDAMPTPWTDGVRPERKYQSFRHDQATGSFHPHHRAKWSTHELLHGLVGCAWRPGATPFFHATAGRLAELLPVALWYFFDEAFLRRCDRHAGQGALFRTTCDRCEAVAAMDPTADGRGWVRDGLRFVEAELAAVARSRRTGSFVPNRWATIDLCSDGVAYARAHGPRLASPEMARFAHLDHAVADLDALEERVLAVLAGLLGDGIPPHDAAPIVWQRQDLAWRLLVVRAQTAGEAGDALDAIVDGLADADSFADADAAYRAVHADWELPEPDEVFAVGYPLPGTTPTCHAFIDGLRTGLPKVDWVLAEALDGLGDRFAAVDLAAPSRRPLALRFADFLTSERPDLAAAARFEGTVTSLPRGAYAALPERSADGRVRCAPGVRAVRFEVDAAAVLDALEGGSTPPDSDPTGFVIGRDAAGEPVVVDVDPEWVEPLLSERGLAVTSDVEDALLELGLVEPVTRAERQ